MEEFKTIVAIVERAEKCGIAHSNRITNILDMEFANKQFHIRLDDMLHANQLDFSHDFCGIQANMNRDTCRVENFFVPRFAG